MRVNKWYSLIAASLLYFIYCYKRGIYAGAGFLDYLDLIVNVGILFAIAVWLIRKSTVNNAIEQIISFGFVLYMFVLHRFVTYIYIPYYFTQEYIGNPYVNLERINLIPFKTISNDLLGTVVDPVTVMQTFGNLFLLLPLAFSLLALQIVKKKRKVAMIIFFTTLFIETFQLVENLSVSGYLYSEGGVRAVDIDDLILNTLGGIIGIFLYRVYKKVLMKNRPLRH
ncbi:glycopeptide antibiotics resistance protein [Oikeobacillus pervagus]|uniref:Glycopeptide antibiotics resistance protein n=1 Tax=Oikeobacillus pervagus TaxID=1325931 RepID=A0AAJ1SZN5_9BACI|nr:VanZ family protein [Oikeobacillus pervagus]MDQ0215800.1 glycopeptide antibiotics resistance protein [Oikeobacillus pervagus]